MRETAPEATHGGEGPAAGRRRFLTAAATLVGATALAPTAFAQRFGPGAPPVRYPDPAIVILDPERFTAAIDFTSIQRLYTGTLWAEGPAWNGVGRYLVFSDVPGDEQLRWVEEDGRVSRRFRYPSGNLNGNTFDRRGRQISCQHVTRRVVRFEYDGGMTVLAEAFGGKPLNAPNDVVVRRDDGSIWFTDPGNGSLLAYEGTHPDTGSVQPFQKEAIYRIDGQNGRLTKVADQPFKPNGLAFSPDYRTLYAADIGSAYYPEAENIIWRFDVDGDRLSNARTFCSMELDGRSGRASTASQPTSTATSGRAPAGSARAMMASTSSRRTASASAKSACPRSAPTSVSAARTSTGCS